MRFTLPDYLWLKGEHLLRNLVDADKSLRSRTGVSTGMISEAVWKGRGSMSSKVFKLSGYLHVAYGPIVAVLLFNGVSHVSRLPLEKLADIYNGTSSMDNRVPIKACNNGVNELCHHSVKYRISATHTFSTSNPNKLKYKTPRLKPQDYTE